MKKRLIIISTITFFLCTSCRNKVDKGIIGWWSMDTIYYKGYDIKYCLWLNTISFRKNSCEFEETNGNCLDINESGKYGTWKVNTDNIPYTLEIRSENKIFDGKHTIKFKRDDGNKLLKMEIESDSLYIVCRKGLFNYKENEKLINELVEEDSVTSN